MNNKLSFSLAVLLHIAVGVLLFSKFETTLQVSPVQVEISAPKPIVEAVAIDASELQQEMARLESIDKQKQEQEKAQQQKLAQQKAALEQARKKEEQRLAALKLEQEKLKQQQAQKEKERLENERLAKEKLEKEKSAIEKLRQEKEKLEQEKQKIELAKRKAEEEKRKVEAERLKAEAEKQKQLAAKRLEDERQAKLAADRLTQERQNRHASLIADKVNQNWRQPIGIELSGLQCVLRVRVSETGEVLEASVVQSSGNLEFDRSSELAVRKSSPLPLPSDPNLINKFRDFNFNFNPGNA